MFVLRTQATPRWVDASKEEIDPGKKIHSVVVEMTAHSQETSNRKNTLAAALISEMRIGLYATVRFCPLSNVSMLAAREGESLCACTFAGHSDSFLKGEPDLLMRRL